MENPRLLELLRTSTDTCGNLTGTWRYFRPVFEGRRPPCAAECPAGNDVREFMRLAAKGDLPGALAAIKQENPLPSVCGRVCHHPCTEACSRNRVDQPLAVNLIERHLGDLARENGLCLPEPKPATGRSVAVVGSGPAGLACAYHAALLGHDVTIFESGPEPGGMLRRGIPAYRLPRERLDADLSFIAALGIELKTNRKIKSLDDLSGFDAACLCLGAHAGRPLDVPGAGTPGVETRGVWAGLEFLGDINAGGRPDVGGRAVIIGGGNAAMDCARAALRMGATATVLYRREEGDMPALPDEIAEAREEGVAFEFLAMPVRIIERGGRVRAVECLRTKPGEPGPDGRRR
ncbi:MAG: FAD-dependent oxidoreductase, partial [bacterium]